MASGKPGKGTAADKRLTSHKSKADQKSTPRRGTGKKK